jgi:hypothetical protein
MENLIFIDSIVKMPLVNLPVRSVIVPVEDKSILISPGSQVQEWQYKPNLKVTDVVAPSLFQVASRSWWELARG